MCNYRRWSLFALLSSGITLALVLLLVMPPALQTQQVETTPTMTPVPQPTGTPTPLPGVNLGTSGIFTAIATNSGAPPLYSVYEIAFDLPATYSEADRFDPSVVDVSAIFTLPGGGTETMPGFYKQDTSPHWAVRYAPRVPGAYTSRLRVVDSSGTHSAPGPSFTTSAPANAGFITADGVRLKTSNGNAFVIDGINAAWSETRPDGSMDVDYSYEFDQMKAYNMNFARIWASVYWDAHAIEWGEPATAGGIDQDYHGIGKYNLANAKRADTIFANAQKDNIYIMWTLAAYIDFETQWEHNAYNSRNGGPCTVSTCFEENTTARAYWKRYLRYTFARWGAYSSFGIVEFWNESDKDSIDSNGLAWHQEMDDAWKSIDMYHHPTTTSFAWKDHYDEQNDTYPTWNQMTFLTVANQHRYEGMRGVVDLWLSELQQIGTEGGNKPRFFAEYGTIKGGGEDASSNDPHGYFYHDGVWVPFFFGEAAGTNMIWRVDEKFIPHGQTAQPYKAFGAFLHDELAALPGMSYSPPVVLANNIRVGKYQNKTRALLLFRDWSATWDTTPTVQQNVSYTLTGLEDRAYTIQYWNTMDGTFTQTTETAAAGKLTLHLPGFQRAIAVKVY